MGKNTRGTSKAPDPTDDGLPVSLDAERFVLGSVLAGFVEFPAVYRSLVVNDFSLEKHRRIFSSITDLHARGEHIDRVTVAEELRRKKQLESVDGVSYLVSLDEGMPQIANIDAYIGILQKKCALRQIIFAADGVQKRAFLAIGDPALLIASARHSFDEIEGTDTSDRVIEEIPSTWSYEATTTTYLVENLLVEGAVTLWSGESGDAKSTFALALAGAVAQGHPFLGRPTIQLPVVYLDRENPVAVVKDRLFHLGIPDISDRLKIWGTWWERIPARKCAVICSFTGS
jgi:hypothetical protein